MAVLSWCGVFARTQSHCPESKGQATERSGFRATHARHSVHDKHECRRRSSCLTTLIIFIFHCWHKVPPPTVHHHRQRRARVRPCHPQFHSQCTRRGEAASPRQQPHSCPGAGGRHTPTTSTLSRHCHTQLRHAQDRVAPACRRFFGRGNEPGCGCGCCDRKGSTWWANRCTCYPAP